MPILLCWGERAAEGAARACPLCWGGDDRGSHRPRRLQEGKVVNRTALSVHADRRAKQVSDGLGRLCGGTLVEQVGGIDVASYRVSDATCTVTRPATGYLT